MTTANADQVTVSKADYDTLTKIKALMDKAWDSKDTGPSLRKLLKTVEPGLKIPEDIADSVIAPVNTRLEGTEKSVKELGDRLTKFLDETTNEKATSRLRDELTSAQKKFGLDDEGMTKVMQRMKDKANPDVEAAAAWVASQAPKPQPISDHGISSISADLFGSTKQEDQWKALQTGGDPFRPGGWFDQTAAKILSEPAEQAA